jgi:hypothetical protein
MHTFLDAKAMAKTLRAALAKRNIPITHSDSLELVAQQFGFKDWNVLAAEIAAARFSAMPDGWFRTGTSDAALHRMGVDPANPADFRIESLADSAAIAGRFASFGRAIAADDYRGGSIRLGVELRGEACDRAFAWLRVDPMDGQSPPLAFDNLGRRTTDGMLSGTFGWTRRAIVLPVVEGAGRILHGAGLVGTGTLWIRNIAIGPAERGARPDGEGFAA